MYLCLSCVHANYGYKIIPNVNFHELWTISFALFSSEYVLVNIIRRNSNIYLFKGLIPLTVRFLQLLWKLSKVIWKKIFTKMGRRGLENEIPPTYSYTRGNQKSLNNGGLIYWQRMTEQLDLLPFTKTQCPILELIHIHGSDSSWLAEQWLSTMSLLRSKTVWNCFECPEIWAGSLVDGVPSQFC